MHHTSGRLWCRPDPLPIKYLGLPLEANPRRYDSWKGVIDNVRRRLNAWKGRFLSLGRRIVLIKSVINSIPLFFMSVFRIPKKVLKELESLARRFL